MLQLCQLFLVYMYIYFVPHVKLRISFGVRQLFFSLTNLRNNNNFKAHHRIYKHTFFFFISKCKRLSFRVCLKIVSLKINRYKISASHTLIYSRKNLFEIFTRFCSKHFSYIPLRNSLFD